MICFTVIRIQVVGYCGIEIISVMLYSGNGDLCVTCSLPYTIPVFQPIDSILIFYKYTNSACRSCRVDFFVWFLDFSLFFCFDGGCLLEIGR